MIERESLFIQVTYKDLARYLWLICAVKINIELYVNEVTLDSYQPDDIERISRRLDSRGISRNVHGPIINPHKDGFDIFREYCRKAVEFSALLKAGSIVLHAEYDHNKFKDPNEWIDSSAPIWKEAVEAARSRGISVLLENHYEHTGGPIVRLLDRVGSDSFKACFDVGHFHAFGDKDLLEILDEYPPGLIGEVHLSDNAKEGDSHLPLGAGSVDFKSFFDAVDKKGIAPLYVIEAKNIFGIWKGLRYLRRTVGVGAKG
jgi:sugar phosphate isomerase/epimerase